MEVKLFLFLWILTAFLRGSAGAPQPNTLSGGSDSDGTAAAKTTSNVSKHDGLLAWFNLFGDYGDRADMTSSAAAVASPVASVDEKKSTAHNSASESHDRSPQSFLAQPAPYTAEGQVRPEDSFAIPESADKARQPPLVAGPPPTQPPLMTPPPVLVRLPDPIDWNLLPKAMEYPGGMCLTSKDRRVGTCLPVNLPCGANYEKESPEMCNLAMGTKCCVNAYEASQGLPIAEVFPGGKCKVADGRVGDCRHRDLGCNEVAAIKTKGEAVCIRDLYDCCLPSSGGPKMEVVSRSLPSGCTITDGRTGVCVSVNFGCPSGMESPPTALCSIVMGLKCCVPAAQAQGTDVKSGAETLVNPK